MEPRFVMFRAENAVNAQLFARRLTYVCVHKPKRKYPRLVAWCEPLKDALVNPPLRPEWGSGSDETVVS
jgi:hypothetical protein